MTIGGMSPELLMINKQLSKRTKVFTAVAPKEKTKTRMVALAKQALNCVLDRRGG